MYKFNKTAGLILDQQDDPGAGWDLISAFWPDNMDSPSLGQDIEKKACAIQMTDGIEKIARYPVDTPENTLASSMYFLAFGKDSMENLDDIVKVAELLQEYRIAHGVTLPEDFKDFVKSAEVYEEQDPVEIYADSQENLPVTTPEQTRASINLFEKNAHMWPTSERMLYSAKLQKAAEYHNIDADLKYASTKLASHAPGAIDLRLAMIQQVGAGLDKESLSDYTDGMEQVKLAMFDHESYNDILKIAEDIENLDRQFGLDYAWGQELPDPIESVLEGFNPDPFDTTKHAQVDWDSVAWDDLPFEDDVVSAIKDDPEVVIPTLPTAQRNIVEDHVYGKSKV